ncbi:MAG TPA: PhzF family phenazine biosynthesis protein [Solirubrobacteraceae bacterium]|nr:PhzF family phenazine biosynthesis protein [Solirubrobacteraceae bacterium]
MPGSDSFAIIDVFTDTPLQGNQLGVFPHADAIPAERMQPIALELGFSETVFVLPARNGGDARLRIFTPTNELPFAGHPVLGSAFLVGEEREAEELALETGAGVVSVALRRENARVAFGTMAQPLPSWELYEHADEILRALGIERSGLPIEEYRNGPHFVYVELPDAAAVASLEPDQRALARLRVGIYCFAVDGTTVKSRMFAPGMGVAEDPATGSAAGSLAVHLALHRRIEFGTRIEIHQGAEIGRPSVLYACAQGSSDELERVEVGGGAVIVARGEFLAGTR